MITPYILMNLVHIKIWKVSLRSGHMICQTAIHPQDSACSFTRQLL